MNQHIIRREAEHLLSTSKQSKRTLQLAATASGPGQTVLIKGTWAELSPTRSASDKLLSPKTVAWNINCEDQEKQTLLITNYKKYIRNRRSWVLF